MTVICNATPLINFAVINRLDILQATFERIVIPQAVYDETTGSGFPSTQFVLQAIASGWLQVRPVATIAPTSPVELDDGEREAIALALEIGEGRILLIAVWLLVEARRLDISEAQLLNDYPHITSADLVNAWAYADAHPEEIEAAIHDNNQVA